MLRTMSSTRPRVLRRMPIWSAGFQGMPLALAANIVPPSLPVTATRRMIASQLQPLLENISHPRYVRGRVRLLWPNVSSSEREDRESELLIFLMTLPKKSKFRALGYNGPPKRLQGPRPDLQSGACPRCFRAPLLSLHKDDPDEPLYIVVVEGLVEPRPTIQHPQPLFIGSGWDAHR